MSKLLTFLFLCCMSMLVSATESTESQCPQALNMEMRKLHSKQTVNLCDFFQPDKPLLIVNTASHCGYTKQFAGLEALYKKYQAKGLVVLGFPSDSFKQEEAKEEDTARVCYQNYGVTFPMFEHVDVKGAAQHPVFAYVASRTEDPGWNFTKYLLLNDQVRHFSSEVKPQDSALEEAIRRGFEPTTEGHLQNRAQQL